MLRLRPYKSCDAEQIAGWIQDETSFWKWSAGRYDRYPICADDINEEYNRYAFADHFWAMTAFDESGVTGHLIMRFLDEEKKILRFGFIIVDDAKRGMGYGKNMLLLALKYAFDIVRVEKVTLGVFENNESAHRCYQSVGFRETGNVEWYRIGDEDWKCLEMEIQQQAGM